MKINFFKSRIVKQNNFLDFSNKPLSPKLFEFTERGLVEKKPENIRKRNIKKCVNDKPKINCAKVKKDE